MKPHPSTSTPSAAVPPPAAQDLRPARGPRSADSDDLLTRFSIRQPADLIGLVPYLLGFHPDESIVAVYLSNGRLVLTGRLDLPPTQFSADLVDHLSGLGDQHAASEIIVLIYSRKARGRRIGHALVDALRPSGLLEVLLVEERRWWSLTCTEEHCCPSAGTAYDRASLPLSAQAVLAGMQALDKRDHLAALVDGPPPGDLPALEAGLVEAYTQLAPIGLARRRRLAKNLVARGLREPAALSDANCLRLAVLIGDIDVRDDVWLEMDRGSADEHLKLWGRVVARTPPVVAVAPVCLFGVAAWLNGFGALLNCAIDRASLLDQHYSLISLLSELSGAAVAPSWWDDWVEELRSAHADAGGPASRRRDSDIARSGDRAARSRRSDGSARGAGRPARGAGRPARGAGETAPEAGGSAPGGHPEGPHRPQQEGRHAGP